MMGKPGDRKRRKELKRKKQEERRKRTQARGLVRPTGNIIEQRVAALNLALDAKFETALSELESLFHQFDYVDCAYALLIFELWLPNIASTIKIQLFAGTLASLAPERKEPVLLSDYSKFCDFCSRLVASSPTFTLLEDYVPE